MSNRRTIILSVIGIAAAVLLSLLLLQMRHAGSTRLAGNQPGSLTRHLQELDERLAAVPDPTVLRERLHRETDDVEKEYTLAANVMPEAVNSVSLQALLGELAEKAGVNLKDSILGQPEPVNGGSQAVPLTLRLDGGFDEVAGFVGMVEGLDHPSGDNPRHIEVATIMAVSQPEHAVPEWTLSLRTYAFQGDDSTVTGGSSEVSLAELAAARSLLYVPGDRDIMAPPAAVASKPVDQPAASEPQAGLASMPTMPTRREDEQATEVEEMAEANSNSRHIDAAEAADVALEAVAEPAASHESDLLAQVEQYHDELERQHGSPAAAELFAALGVKLEGISWSSDSPRAVINGGIFATGDQILENPEVRVAAIDRTTVTFVYRGVEHIVGVKMFAPQ